MYEGQVARNNATIAAQNADYSRQAGQQQATITSMKGAAKGADIKTGLAAHGVDVNTGSALDVEAGQRETNELDTETVLNNADLQAYGYTTQAVNDKAQAQQDEVGGILGAAGTLVGSASSLGLKWNSGGSSAGASNWGG
jgi:undecaprenyl pyrophosphate synthase